MNKLIFIRRKLYFIAKSANIIFALGGFKCFFFNTHISLRYLATGAVVFFIYSFYDKSHTYKETEEEHSRWIKLTFAFIDIFNAITIAYAIVGIKCFFFNAETMWQELIVWFVLALIAVIIYEYGRLWKK